MKHTFNLLLTIFLAANIFSNFILQDKARRETVLDRKVHLEKEIILDIPRVPRWCDKLDLRKRRLNVGNCELYVEEEGKGIPIVLLHGGPGGTHHSFHPHFSQAKGFARIIYYDQRGCGLSDYQKGNGYTVEQAVDDLENLRQALKIKRWVVLGWSYGGYLGQRYIMKYPKSISGLVLVTAEPGLFGKLKPTRQYDFISEKERKRMNEVITDIFKLSKQKKFSQDHIMELIGYNRHISGDWKRQHYYRPTEEEFARAALYEWKHDTNFNSIINQDMRRLDLESAFKECPIPTLIIESKWDLTWNTDKPEKLDRNHPGAELVMFEHSGHSPFTDEPEKFFQILRNFIQNLPQICSADLSSWKEYLAEWKKKKDDPLLAGEMSQGEKASIEEFTRIRSKIQARKEFVDGSTPLRALLTVLSSLHFRDKDSLERNSPLDFKKLGQKITEEMMAEWEADWSRLDILRAPPPPDHPQEGEFWPIYVKEVTGKELKDTLLVVFWKGKWMYFGNLNNPGNWR